MIDIMENKILGPAIRQGIEQGKIEGRVEGEREFLSRQLTRRFGPLPAAAVSQLHSASEPELLNWAEQLLTAGTLDEVLT